MPTGPFIRRSGSSAHGGRLGVGDESRPSHGRLRISTLYGLGEAADVEARINDSDFHPRAPFIEHCDSVFQGRHPVVALVPYLRDPDELKVIHLLFQLPDADADVAPPIVSDDGRFRLRGVELLQDGEPSLRSGNRGSEAL